MEIRQLRYFLVVAEELHFGRAAERLTIAQSVVSQQIRRLENDLGTRLFDRTTRTVTLTEAGQRLTPHARAVLTDIDRARRDLEDLRDRRNATVRLGTSTGLGTRLPQILRSFTTAAPNASLELVSLPRDTRLRQVRSGQLDAAVIHGALPSTGDLETVPLWNDTLVAALPDSYAVPTVDGAIDLAVLRRVPLRIATRQRNSALHDEIIEACERVGFTPQLGPAFSTEQDTLAAIAAGPAAWTVYFRSQAESLAIPGIAFRPFTPPAPQLPAALAVRPVQLSAELKALIRACHEAA